MTSTAARPSAPQRIAIDRQTHTITLWRRLSAAPERVFRAWTRAEEVAEWWDPSGRRLARCEIDLRVGGSFSFVPEGHPPFSGVYRDIIPPDRLSFEANGAVGNVQLERRDGGTLMTVSIACGSAEHLEMYLKLGVDEGTERTLDNLVAHVAGEAA